jgi:hypothetical protein
MITYSDGGPHTINSAVTDSVVVSGAGTALTISAGAAVAGAVPTAQTQTWQFEAGVAAVEVGAGAVLAMSGGSCTGADSAVTAIDTPLTFPGAGVYVRPGAGAVTISGGTLTGGSWAGATFSGAAGCNGISDGTEALFFMGTDVAVSGGHFAVGDGCDTGPIYQKQPLAVAAWFFGTGAATITGGSFEGSIAVGTTRGGTLTIRGTGLTWLRSDVDAYNDTTLKWARGTLSGTLLDGTPIDVTVWSGPYRPVAGPQPWQVVIPPPTIAVAPDGTSVTFGPP